MFVAFCPLHDCEVLLGLSRIRNLANLAPGVLALELECYDGQRLAVLTRQAPGRWCRRLGLSAAPRPVGRPPTDTPG